MNERERRHWRIQTWVRKREPLSVDVIGVKEISKALISYEHSRYFVIRFFWLVVMKPLMKYCTTKMVAAPSSKSLTNLYNTYLQITFKYIFAEVYILAKT